MTVSEIADYLDGTVEGSSDIEISGIGKIESAKNSEITFIANPLYIKQFAFTNAGAVLVSEDFDIPVNRFDISIIRVKDPYRGFLMLLEKFEEDSEEYYEGISDKCTIGNDVELGKNVYVADFAFISDGCKIGDKTQIHSNCSIDKSVSIGGNVIIYPNVTIYKGCQIGNNCIIHSGTVIGSDGFGQAKQDDGSYKKIPQRGIVKIGDDVEIGSNCSIDRATIGETLIESGVKIDNQVQIAHNVVIGENTVLAAQVGIAGSTKIGKRVMIGGQSGIVGHISICDDVIIGASVGVSKPISKPGFYTGYRAKASRDSLKLEANIGKIESILSRISNIEKKINQKQ